MSLKEYVAHEMETLGETELLAVAEYLSFLKFRAQNSGEENRLAALYGEFDREDRELAVSGMDDYASALAREDAL